MYKEDSKNAVAWADSPEIESSNGENAPRVTVLGYFPHKIISAYLIFTIFNMMKWRGCCTCLLQKQRQHLCLQVHENLSLCSNARAWWLLLKHNYFNVGILLLKMYGVQKIIRNVIRLVIVSKLVILNPMPEFIRNCLR